MISAFKSSLTLFIQKMLSRLDPVAAGRHPWIASSLYKLVPGGRFACARTFYRLGRISLAAAELREFRSGNPSRRQFKERIEEFQAWLSAGRPPTLNVEGDGVVGAAAGFNGRVVMALYNSAPHDANGYVVRTRNVLRQLVAQGIEVVAMTRPGYPWDLRRFRKAPRVRTEAVDGVCYYRVGADVDALEYHPVSKYMKLYADNIVGTARNHGASVVHAASNYLVGYSAIAAAKALGVASVYEMRGLWHLSHASKNSGFERTEFFSFMDMMERETARAADAVVVISEAMRTQVLGWGLEPHKVFVVPNCVSTSLFQPVPRDHELRAKFAGPGDMVVGFIGSVVEYEGLDTLVAALHKVRKQGAGVVLVVVGDGAAVAALKAQVEELGLSDAVKFTGRVPFESVGSYYSIFDVCVYARKDFEVCRKVPPLKILEAMAMGVPVIASDLPPLVEIVEDGDTGLTVPPDDVDALAGVLARMAADPDLRQRLGAAGLQWVRANRSWEDMGKRYVHVYHTAVANQRWRACP